MEGFTGPGVKGFTNITSILHLFGTKRNLKKTIRYLTCPYLPRTLTVVLLEAGVCWDRERAPLFGGHKGITTRGLMFGDSTYPRQVWTLAGGGVTANWLQLQSHNELIQFGSPKCNLLSVITIAQQKPAQSCTTCSGLGL